MPSSYRLAKLYLILLPFSYTTLIAAQSISPGAGAPSPKSRTFALAVGAVSPSCPTEPPYRWYFPLNTDCAGKDEMVQGFFGTDTKSGGPLSYVNQVKYLYGLGQTASTISADLFTDTVSAAGLEVTFGSSISSNGPASASSTMPSPGSSSSTASAATTAQAAEQLENGGDFYLQAIYPMLYKGNLNNFAFIIANPKIGFNFSGFGSQNTITETTEYNVNTSVEAYGQGGTDKGISAQVLHLRPD